METRKESLSSLKLCRFCLTAEETLIPLYDNKVRAPKHSVPFALKILACIAIEIFPSDRMPQYVCQRCKLFMEVSYAFKQLCRQADEAILQFIQNGTPLVPLAWPSQLNKVFKATHKPDVNVVKTVVQGGATVKVMAEEVSDSEAGEEDNVYNIQIGDGTDEGKNIKIITSIDKNKGRQGISKNVEESERQDVSVVAGCWPCDECECTYPLEQLLTLHKAQKHRVRSEICDECGGRFFSKNDLEVHQLTHSSEMPFQCVACEKKFKRLILLKRHEKIMHSELPQLSCGNCPATFLSTEELSVHMLRHERHPVRTFNCFVCHKSFPNNTILQRHIAMVHSKKAAFSCQYCPEQFPSVAKLTRHVREHAGERPYPCKHCDKSFTKSHHYTRHLRLKHAETTRTPGPYNESDAYRCDECEESFATQDELMYHSALHATRNLTCPLCQEKFDDVDTVTAHIKSHVNGTEFMCDFCELIFTTKEKLDSHIAKVHDDELLANDQETEHDESSMDMDAEEDDDDNLINVKEENGEMVVEIKKPGDYMLPAEEDKGDNTQSEDSDMIYADSPGTEMEAMPTPKQPQVIHKELTPTKVPAITPKQPAVVAKTTGTIEVKPVSKPSPILRKAEDIKRKAAMALLQQPPVSVAEKKEKPKVETSSAPTGANDKSLRLLEKELQDLKRTNSRSEVAKTPAKNVESLRSRRPQLFSSTPKNRNSEKKDMAPPKPTPEKTSLAEKKQPDRKPKDTREPKEVKSNNNSIKEDRELRGNKEDKDTKGNKEEKEVKGNKEDKDTKGNKEEKEVKGNKEDKETKVNKEERETKVNRKEEKVQKEERNEIAKVAYSTVLKNGGSDTPTAPAEDSVRRSTRPSKVKDYAKMIRDSSMNSDEDDTDAEADEEEYKEPEKTLDASRGRARRGSNKPPAPAPTPTKVAAPDSEAETPATAPRKRGRPRKEVPKSEVPNKIKKDEPSEEDADTEAVKTVPSQRDAAPKENQPGTSVDRTKTPDANKMSEARPGVIISPSGQTLKQVPIKALPPGVKALPLPGNSTRLGGGEVTEMQIGKKIVKVQKIVMTKAEVEAMTKKGLLEIKDGTMVLKQGIKLPAVDSTALKSNLVADSDKNKESQAKTVQQSSGPARFNLDA